jgi:peptidoglycan hydrolase-like protein with peptidoglycan-binding domain
MRLVQYALLSCITLTLTIPAQAAHRSHRTSVSSHKLFAKHAAKPKFQTQRAMDDDRATQIQSALIRAGYLSGTPTGHWDTESEAAMQKLQGDNGWQTKLVPDSRALIKLGLGPNSTPAGLAAPLASSVTTFGPATSTVAPPAIIAQARP